MAKEKEAAGVAQSDTQYDKFEKVFNTVIPPLPGGRKQVDEAYKDITEEPEKEKVEEPKVEEAEEAEEVEPSEEPSGEKKEEEYEEIPLEQVEAARKRGYSDAQIEKIAEDYPELLTALARADTQAEALIRRDVPSLEVPLAKEPEKPKKLARVEIDTSLMDEGTGKVVNGLVANINAQNELINDLNEKLGMQGQRLDGHEKLRQVEWDSYVNSLFDGVESFPQIGKSPNISNSGLALRKKVYAVALDFQRTDGGNFESSLNEAVRVFKARYGNTEKELAQKLEKTKKRITARPGGQKAAPKFKSSDEKVMSALEESGRKIGLSW